MNEPTDDCDCENGILLGNPFGSLDEAKSSGVQPLLVVLMEKLDYDGKSIAKHFADEKEMAKPVEPVQLDAKMDHEMVEWDLKIALRDGLNPKDPAPQATSCLKYAVLVDAGSSGGRLGVVHWAAAQPAQIRTVNINKQAAMFRDLPQDMTVKDGQVKEEPGWHKYVDQMDNVSWDTDGKPKFLAMVKEAQAYIPNTSWNTTQLFVKATAGLRLTSRSAPEQTQLLLHEIQQTCGSTVFLCQKVTVITGAEEGFFAFLSVNAGLGKLSYSDSTVTILELGGVSMQVSGEIPTERYTSDFTVALGNRKVSIYSKSIMGCGQDALRQKLLEEVRREDASPEPEHPCYPTQGTWLLELTNSSYVKVKGAWDAERCNRLVTKLARECGRLDGLPPLSGEVRALSALPFTLIDLGLMTRKEEKFVSTEEIAARTVKLCSQSWEFMKKPADGNRRKEEILRDLCLVGLYIPVLLQEFGLQDNKELIYGVKVNGESAEWTRGAMLWEAMRSAASAESVCSKAGRSSLHQDAPEILVRHDKGHSD